MTNWRRLLILTVIFLQWGSIIPITRPWSLVPHTETHKCIPGEGAQKSCVSHSLGTDPHFSPLRVSAEMLTEAGKVAEGALLVVRQTPMHLVTHLVTVGRGRLTLVFLD